MYNPIRIMKASKFGVFTAIGAVIALTMLLAACPEETPTGPAGPSSPTNLTVEISGSQAVLTWDAVADAVEYRVYRANGPNELLVRINTDAPITGTTFTDTGLTNGIDYRYVVRAVDSADRESGDSEQVNAIPNFLAPENLVVEISDGQAELTWGTVADAVEYRIYSVGSDGTLTRIAENIIITETTFTVTGLDNGTAYRYVVRAVDSSGGESGDSGEINATPELTIPPVPKNLTANPADTQITLSWDASNSAEEYRVYRASTPNGTLTRIAGSTTITATSYTDTGLTNDTEYRYTVRAFNSIGESTDSNEVTATPVASTTVPPAPANFSAIAGDTEVSLSWDAVPGATEYRIYRAAAANDPLVRIAGDTMVVVTTYTDTGLTNGTAYRYTVRAVNGIGEGPGSSEAAAAPALAAPAAPENFRAAATANREVTLTWNAVDNAAEYQVFRADTVDGDFTRIDDSTTITDPTYTDTGLANGTAYRYIVRAVNAAGISPDSSEVSVTTLALPAAPANLTATASVVGSDIQVTLTWDAVTGATAYQIYRADTADGTLTRIAEDTTITAVTYTDTGLTHTTTYRYTVRTVDSVGEGADSAEASATTRGLLAAPANLSATASGAADVFEVSLSWDAVTGATEYRVYRADTADGALERVTTDSAITGTTYTDTGLAHSTAYRYIVRAVDVIGESLDSAEASATTPAVPGAPGNVRASARIVMGAAQILLSWNAVTGATEYQVYRAATATGTFARIASSTTITAATYTDTGFTSGTTYRYTVRAVDSVGTSADSAEISVVAPASLAAPANLTAVKGERTVSLSWDAVTGATGYRVYRAATADGALTRTRILGTVTTYTDTFLTNGTAYRYVVRAANNLGESADSSEVTATPSDHSNTMTGATPVTSGVAITGTLAATGPTGDPDYFSITVTATASSPVTITAETTGTTDTGGQISNSTGTVLATDDNSGESNNFRASTTVMATGTYYIRVIAQTGTGFYNLTITAQ